MYLQSSIDQLSTLRCNGLSQQLQCTLSSSVMEGEILLFSLLNQNTLHSNERPNAPQTHNHYDYPVTLAALLTAPWPQVPPAATLLAWYYMLTAPRLQVPLLLPYQHGITCSLHYGYKFPLLLPY